jgi:hypothetical protein
MASRLSLKSFFSRGAKPTAGQFASLIDSFWSKDEDTIPISKITNLPTTLAGKGAAEDLQNETANRVIADAGLQAQIDKLVANGVGAPGAVGPQGESGAPGAAGVGVPIGGTPGQILAKNTNEDFDTHWVDASAGGGDYTLPIATNTVLGGVKQGSNVIITADGTLNALTGAANSNVILTVDSFLSAWNYLLGNTADITIAGDCRLDISNVPDFACGILIVRQSSTGGAKLRLPNGSRRESGFSLSTAANAVDLLAFYFDGNNYYWSMSKAFDTPTQDFPYMIWQNLINTQFDGTTLTKTNSSGWNGSAIGSKKVQLSGTGEQGRLTFDHLVVSGAMVIGFSNTVGDSSYSSIQYAFYWDSSSGYVIYESGTSKATGTLISGTTKLEIVLSDTDVKYYKNDILIYTSLMAPVFPLYVDISMNPEGSSLTNVQLSGNLIDA